MKKVICIPKYELCSARAGAKGKNDDSTLQSYTTAQPGADSLIIKTKFTLWTIRKFASTIISLRALQKLILLCYENKSSEAGTGP